MSKEFKVGDLVTTTFPILTQGADSILNPPTEYPLGVVVGKTKERQETINGKKITINIDCWNIVWLTGYHNFKSNIPICEEFLCKVRKRNV